MERYRVVNKEEERLYCDENLENIRCEYIRSELFGDCPHAGNQKAPYFLCKEIINKLPDLNGKNILILFNPEFYYVIKKYYNKAKFTFITGSKRMIEVKLKNVELLYCNPLVFKEFEDLVKDLMGKFDVIIGIPPYKDIDGRRADLIYPEFVEKSFDLVKENGYISFIHSPSWRKFGNRLLNKIQSRYLEYLEIHNLSDGQRVFGNSSPYDWYILQNNKTTIIDEDGEQLKININDWDFLPNKEYDLFLSLLAENDKDRCEVVYSRSAYGSDKNWMKKQKDEIFKYPCVNTMTQKDPLRFLYSNTNENGHFNIPKVIINITNSVTYFFNDYKGEYGMTGWVFGIKISSKEEGENIIKALGSEKFKLVLEASKWSPMVSIEWKIFKLFRKDFWKEFI